MEKRSEHELEQRRGDDRPRRHRGGPEDFFGLDVDKMSSKAQVITALVVLIPVALSAIPLFTVFAEVWWIFMTYGWVVFPAFGLLVRGIAGLSDSPAELPASNSKERELLGALREHGELTPARAAMETSLTVAEADEKLKELAEGGHLDVRVRGGGLFYALWEPDGEEAERGAGRELEGRG